VVLQAMSAVEAGAVARIEQAEAVAAVERAQLAEAEWRWPLDLIT
jgi:hypothetical protein